MPATDSGRQTAGALPDILALTTVIDSTTTPPTLVSVDEIGPAILLPRRQGDRLRRHRPHRDLYAPATASWTAGPDFPADPGDPSNNNTVLSPTAC